MRIDNFMLTNWQTCPAKYKLSNEDHWQPKMKSAALGFGAVIHEGIAEWYRGSIEGRPIVSRLEAAIEKIIEKFPADHPVDDYRNLNKAIEVMKIYADTYPGENFQVLQVEVPFTLDLGLALDCGECGERWDKRFEACPLCANEWEWIEYGGILDTITAFGQVLYILEHKTTSQLGPLFFRQFETSNQVTGYCWGLKQLSNKRVAGADINAICVTTSGKISMKRETTNRSDQDFEVWKQMVRVECNTIAYHKRTGVWPYRTEQCLGKYGLCSYHSVHTLSTPAEQQRRLETAYEQREWDHELRDVRAT